MMPTWMLDAGSAVTNNGLVGVCMRLTASGREGEFAEAH